MRLGVYVPRRSSFTLMAPLIDAAVERQHEVVLVGDRVPAKPGDGWSLREAHDAFGALPVVATPRDFCGDWFVATPTPTRSGAHHRAHVDAWFDSLVLPYPDGDAAVTHRTMRHGLLATDGLHRITPRPRDALVWFPPKTMIAGRAQRMLRWVMVATLAPLLRHAARTMHLRFVIKRRPKSTVPSIALRCADAVLNDDRLVPAPSLEAIAGAAVVVMHHSAAGYEAMASGVRAYSIRVPHRHLRDQATFVLMRARYGPANWPGVIDVLPYPDALWRLRRGALDCTLDAAGRQRMIDTWFGGRVRGVAAWLLTAMEDYDA